MPYSNTDTILLYGLTPEERHAVDTANRHTNYQCFEACCVTDLLAVPHLALVANPASLSEADWLELMDQYRQTPKDGAKTFFTRPMLVPPDVTADFHFAEGIKDLRWQLTGYLYRHAVRSGDPWDGGLERRQVLRNYAEKYPYIFFLCFPKNTDLLTDLQMVAREAGRLFLCTPKQCDTYRCSKLHQASQKLQAAARGTGRVTFRFDYEPAQAYEDELLPLMEEEGFLMPVQLNRDTLPILEHFNESSSLLLYPVELSDTAARISQWWQGACAWDGVSLK